MEDLKFTMVLSQTSNIFQTSRSVKFCSTVSYNRYNLTKRSHLVELQYAIVTCIDLFS